MKHHLLIPLIFIIITSPLISQANQDIVWIKEYGEISSIALNPATNNYAICQYDKLILFQMDSLNPDTSIYIGPNISKVNFSNKGEIIGVLTPYIHILNSYTYEKSIISEAYNGGYGMSFSPDDTNIAIGTLIYGVELINLESGKIIDKISKYNTIGIEERGYSIAYSKDGNFLATALIIWVNHTGYFNTGLVKDLMGDSIIYEWDTGGTYEIPIKGLAFGKNNRLFTQISSSKFVKINIFNGEIETEFIGHTGFINDICLNSSDDYMVSCSDDGLIIVWDVDSGDKIYTYNLKPGSNFSEIYITNDDKYFLTTDGKSLYKLHARWEPTDVIEYSDENNFSISPNPTSGKIKLSFEQINPDILKIYLTDLVGNIIRNIKSEYISSGKHEIDLDLSDQLLGIYFINIETSEYTKSFKIILEK